MQGKLQQQNTLCSLCKIKSSSGIQLRIKINANLKERKFILNLHSSVQPKQLR